MIGPQRTKRPGTSSVPTSSTRPQWISTAVKVVVTIGVLAFVFWRIDPRDVLATFANVRSWPLAQAFGWVAIAIVVSAVKWGRILTRRGVSVSLIDLTRLYYIASFFNALLPTSIGGDPVRAWLLGKEKGDMPESFSSVVAERLIASMALGLSSAIGLLFVRPTPGLVALVVVFLLADAGLVVLFLIPRFGESFVRAVIPRRFDHAAEATRSALKKVRDTVRDAPLVLEILAWSVAFQACVAMVNWSLFSAFSAPVPVGQALLYSPMISTISMLPVSLSGLGVPQASYAFFFGLSGAPEAVSVAVSFGFFVVIAVSTLPGAVLFMLARRTGEADGI